MQIAPEPGPGGAFDGWSPVKLLFFGMLAGYFIARLIEPEPRVRVVRYRVLEGGRDVDVEAP